MSHKSATALIGLGLVILQLISLIGVIDGHNVNANFNRESNREVIRAKRLVISYGHAANLDDFPWMAVLVYEKYVTVNGRRMIDRKRGLRGWGSGSILNERYVLTAAHAISKCKENWAVTAVRVGEYNIQEFIDCGPLNGGQGCHMDSDQIPVKDVLVHDNYTTEKSNRQHDIALLRLARRVRYTDYIRPIRLPKNSNIPGVFWIAGWGLTEKNTSSVIKRKAKISIYNWETCLKRYKNFAIDLVDGQICAGGVGHKDACTGDSGAPLMSRDTESPDQQWTIFGIVSFGFPCNSDSSNWPGVYTKVHDYVPWIMDIMKN